MAAIGIDLGTTHCCAATWKRHADTDEDGRVEVIVNGIGGRTTPSFVAFTETDRLIGAPAKAQAHRNPKNTCVRLSQPLLSDCNACVQQELYCPPEPARP